MSGPRLTTQLTLETLDSTSDGAGGMRETWVPLGTLWGELRVRSGRETSGHTGQVSVAGVRIVVRASPPGHSGRPLPEQRFRHGSRVFEIGSVTEEDFDARFLVCNCEEVRVS